ncbi:hypothetical protein GWK36_04560 [Caldichromatium japonicum]|uniref:Uncharacterized protein n=1 Tax=Caldichromatium japonicum TaxID=2699430 RepID=A0A6G7VBX1_9GAMM|nr:hypothetical protein [Caldichromatium japonicum]QIK37375.1 hypothetical protein GWK36_04560 [Caldichromatium japonicum]
MSALPVWLTVPVAPPDLADPSLQGGRICILGFRGGLGPAETLGHLSLLPDVWSSVHWEQVDLGCFSCRPLLETLDRHRLDLCLSRGRQAAERARLAGCRLLLCLGRDSGEDPNLGNRCVRGEPRLPARWPLDPLAWITCAPRLAYACLRRLACPKLAALTGALIASAQMGMKVSALGERARIAARLAQGINPGLTLWLSDRPSAWRITSQRPLERTRCLTRPEQGIR